MAACWLARCGAAVPPRQQPLHQQQSQQQRRQQQQHQRRHQQMSSGRGSHTSNSSSSSSDSAPGATGWSAAGSAPAAATSVQAPAPSPGPSARQNAPACVQGGRGLTYWVLRHTSTAWSAPQPAQLTQLQPGCLPAAAHMASCLGAKERGRKSKMHLKQDREHEESKGRAGGGGLKVV